MSDILPEQGRAGLYASRPPANLHGLPKGQYDDPNQDLPIYLSVAPASLDPGEITVSPGVVDQNWSIRWFICYYSEPHINDSEDVRVWRHIEAIYNYNHENAQPVPRLVYWGPITSAEHILTKRAVNILLLTTSRQTRIQIESLASTIPVRRLGVGWDGKSFIKELLDRMVRAGIINQDTMHNAIRDAELVHSFEAPARTARR